MTVEEALEILEKVLDYKSLNKVQETVFRQSWVGQSYLEIAANTNYEADYIKQVGFQRVTANSSGLWQKHPTKAA